MDIFDELRARIEAFLQARRSFIVSEEFRRSTRGVGDAIEGLIADEFRDIGRGLVDAIDTNFSRRAMEDLSFTGSLEDVTAIVEPIEWFDWECLRIGALGWGQLQFRSASHVRVNRSQTRKDWLRSFAAELREHYAKEENKIKERLDYAIQSTLRYGVEVIPSWVPWLAAIVCTVFTTLWIVVLLAM